MAIDDWTTFLRTWSDEWVAARTDDFYPPVPGDRLGFDPASETEITEAEQRLGLRFPPSYRAFLAASNGWRRAGSVNEMCSTRTVGFFREMTDFVCDMLDGYEQEDLAEDVDLDDPAEGDAERIHAANKWKRAVQVSLEGDLTWFVLDPGDVGPDGEWAAYRYSSWGDMPQRQESFADLMYSMFQSFHQQMKPENTTSRDQDARVAQARADLMAGKLDEARAALEVAHRFGRPRAALLLFQIRALLGETYLMPDVRHLLPEDDPFLNRCLVPVLAWTTERNTYGYQAPDPALDPYRKQVRNGTFTALTGPAVERACELLAWGDDAGAWHVLATEAIPAWRPVDENHVAPIELLADPRLAPIITPDRARLILSTPRPWAAAGVPLPDTTHGDGLTWLLDAQFHSYCITFTQALDVPQLAEHLGVDPAAAVPPPSIPNAAQAKAFRIQDGTVVAVGSTGNGWTFAIESNTDRRGRGQQLLPGVTLWVDSGFIRTGVCAFADDTGTTVCEIIVTADNGYNHTGCFERSGTEPHLLDAALTATGALDKDGGFADIQGYNNLYTFGRRTLQAIEEHFGLNLPRAVIDRTYRTALAADLQAHSHGNGDHAVIRVRTN
ncbi:SMI1/KNR4 family protein [Yinghuangia sp. ASG 101]|uniref:SMI1/KNR4 family protein n=1 Tax=Yinghuangia sp. ASG 101 TaxID=2896848 RepID=UPI001E320EEA|nr:SMI1/KNR4 family protein [Yinghuangia sp. ASG 101]UGQ09072.1 SMI1/KNR4 family protein [Yinghuangia sp. ASG 101]